MLYFAECPQCLDFKFKYFGMEGISQSQMDNILKSLGNVLCETNYEKPTTCNVATYGYTSKCSDVFETVVIKGMKGYDASTYLQIIHRNIMKDRLRFIKKCSDRMHSN